MASVDKVKLGNTTYDISPSKSGTLSGYTSNDAASPTAWAAAEVIAATDTNSTIFSKITTMVKNVRWLYSKLGTEDFSTTGKTTVTGALAALKTGLDGKAASSHSHGVAQLPTSSSQTNSNSYIPTSALVYSMNQKITTLNDALTGSTTKNYVYAAPNGSDGTPGFRKLVAADIPSLAASKITSGTLSSSRLPISTSQTNSTSKVPSSSLVYSMQTKIDELNDATNAFTTPTVINTSTNLFTLKHGLYFAQGDVSTSKNWPFTGEFMGLIEKRGTGNGTESNYHCTITCWNEYDGKEYNNLRAYGNWTGWRITSTAPDYSYSTTDLTAGSSSLTTGKLYFVYE